MDTEEQRLRDEELASYSADDRVISSIEYADLIARESKPSVVLKSGIPTLDAAIGGFCPGELTTISGETGNGKTLIAQTLTNAFDREERNALWFSFEVPAKQFLSQFGENLPLFYLPATLKDKSLAWIDARIMEAVVKYQIHAVFIDHLHYLVDLRAGNNMSLEIGGIMRWLKKAALRHNVAVFLLAHTQKISFDREPDCNSIRDSSFVAQESDNVIFIWRRPAEHPNQAVIKIAKDRKNGVRDKKITLVKEGRFLVELES